MRMWMVRPSLLCRKHLLGEHLELHMLVGAIKQRKSLQGFLDGGLVEPQSIRRRHAELVREMRARGYHHKSPLVRYSSRQLGRISITGNMRELRKRCSECRRLQKEAGWPSGT